MNHRDRENYTIILPRLTTNIGSVTFKEKDMPEIIWMEEFHQWDWSDTAWLDGELPADAFFAVLQHGIKPGFPAVGEKYEKSDVNTLLESIPFKITQSYEEKGYRPNFHSSFAGKGTMSWVYRSDAIGYPVLCTREGAISKPYPLYVADIWGMWKKTVVKGDTNFVFGRNFFVNEKNVYLIDPATNVIKYRLGQFLEEGDKLNWSVWSNFHRQSMFTTKDVAPGKYKLAVHSGLGGKYGWSETRDLEVIAKPVFPAMAKRYKAWYGAAQNTTELQKVVDALKTNGGGTLILEPGVYYINKPIVLGPNLTIDAYGATVICEHQGVAFQPAPFMTMKGLTVKVKHGQTHFYGNNADNSVWEDCTFQRGGFGEIWSRGNILIQNCVFDRCIVNQLLSNAMLAHNKFLNHDGLDDGDAGFSIWSGRDIVAVANEFEGTGRGYYAQPHRGAVAYNYFGGNRFKNIDHSANDGEHILYEGAVPVVVATKYTKLGPKRYRLENAQVQVPANGFPSFSLLVKRFANKVCEVVTFTVPGGIAPVKQPDGTYTLEIETERDFRSDKQADTMEVMNGMAFNQHIAERAYDGRGPAMSMWYTFMHGCYIHNYTVTNGGGLLFSDWPKELEGYGSTGATSQLNTFRDCEMIGSQGIEMQKLCNWNVLPGLAIIRPVDTHSSQAGWFKEAYQYKPGLQSANPTNGVSRAAFQDFGNRKVSEGFSFVGPALIDGQEVVIPQPASSSSSSQPVPVPTPAPVPVPAPPEPTPMPTPSPVSSSSARPSSSSRSSSR
jgi:hypothetical protein